MSTNIRYESILESISGGFFAMDANYKITYWNKAAESGTGMSSAEVLGHHVFDVFPNARGALLGEKYRLAMETRTFQSFETAYRDDRFEKWYDVRIYPADDGLSVFFQDITEKKRDQRQKEIMVEISKAINGAHQLDDLCQRSAEVLAAFEEVPSRLVCVYLYDPRNNELRLVAPATLDIDFPADVVHQIV
ncbi:MAG: domain S-box-containing protein, partial [Bacteroidetes bacterium]|nr:domain S-box-containing protein [Bacteroidota bacterium]